MQAGSPMLVGRTHEPFKNPSLFKKHQKNLDHNHNFDKENERMEKKVTNSSEREETLKKKREYQNSIVMMGENQWYGLKTSRVLSPQIMRSKYTHFI